MDILFDKHFMTMMGLIGSVCSALGLLWRLIQVSNTLAITQSKVDTHASLIPAIINGQGNHAQRLAVIENVLSNLEKIGPALVELGKLSVKLDTIIDQQGRRIEILEDRANKVTYGPG